MATIANVTMSPRPRTAGVRTKPPKLIRGRTRTAIRKTIAKLTALGKEDAREMRRGAAVGYTPTLLLGNANTALNNSYLRVLQRLQDLMSAKVGDE